MPNPEATVETCKRLKLCGILCLLHYPTILTHSSSLSIHIQYLVITNMCIDDRFFPILLYSWLHLKERVVPSYDGVSLSSCWLTVFRYHWTMLRRQSELVCTLLVLDLMYVHIPGCALQYLASLSSLLIFFSSPHSCSKTCNAWLLHVIASVCKNVILLLHVFYLQRLVPSWCCPVPVLSIAASHHTTVRYRRADLWTPSDRRWPRWDLALFCTVSELKHTVNIEVFAT